jgi:hypothetical protein
MPPSGSFALLEGYSSSRVLAAGGQFAAVAVPQDGKPGIEFAQPDLLLGGEMLLAGEPLQQMALIGEVLNQFQGLIHGMPRFVMTWEFKIML